MTYGKTNRIIFFGTEEFSAASLRVLIDAKFTIAAVVTKPDSKKGRGHKLIPPTVKVIAEAHNIPVWQPTKLIDITEAIKQLQPVTGVLVSFGKIIPQATIDLFTPGIINVHPSKLPSYRGPSPIESAILNGDTETGVSIMQLSAAMDAGPVYAFTPRPLTGKETQPELYEALAMQGAQELVKALPAIISGTLTPLPQDDKHATYCQLIQKKDGLIDWKKSAVRIEREIRAYKDWPGSRAVIADTEAIISSAHIEECSDLSLSAKQSRLSIQCGDGSCLAIDTLKPAGKKEMPIQAFLAGHRGKL
jgi:methionyl-tRNA formyltransferase